MKICHMTIVNQMGIPRLRRESHSAVKNGLECCIVSPGKDCRENSIEFIGVPEPRRRIVRFLSTDKQVYKKAIKSNANIYQIHDPELLRYAMRLKRKGKSVLFDSHEFYGLQIKEKYYLPQIIRGLVSWVYMSYEKWICKRIDAVICVCTVNGQNYFENRAKRTVFLPNYPDMCIFTRQMRIEYSERKNMLIHAGLLCESRGITNLAQAAQQAGVKLVLCGTFITNEYKEMILSRFSETVEYLGVLPMDELASVYASTKIGAATLLPVGQYHQADTFATKILEYWSMGMPVITSDSNYVRRFVDSNSCGICVDPNDIEAISDAIKYLRDHPDEAREMGENGRRAVEKEFDWGTQEKVLLDLYKGLET